jgi:hypothetical protein
MNTRGLMALIVINVGKDLGADQGAQEEDGNHGGMLILP